MTKYERRIMWHPVIASGGEKSIPVSRCKHGAALQGQYFYLLGGRNGNLALRDFWRYNIEENVWEEIIGKGDPPGCLQEHTMVAHNNNLYVFGGEISFSNANETPLWIYNTQTNYWQKFMSPKGVVSPKGRRSHTAIVFKESMYIYGGYLDLKGSTSELWAFHFVSKTWHLVSQGGAIDGPPSRHRHTAVLHDSYMWIYGGMTDLQERSDFWKLNLDSFIWKPVRSKPGPDCLHSHSAVKSSNSMILFGGERNGEILNELWKFHFASEYWEKVIPAATKPHPRAQAIALVYLEFRCEEDKNYESKSKQESCKVLAIPGLDGPQKAISRLKNEAEKLIDSRSEGKKYIFLASESCVDDQQVHYLTNNHNLDDNISQMSRDFYRNLKRSNQFQKLETIKQNTLIPKPFAKVSQMNLTRFNQYCSYSMFNNESIESLEESLNSVHISKTLQDQKKCLLSQDVETLNQDNYLNVAKKNSVLDISTDLFESKCIAPRSESELTFQSYDCSSRSSTLSSSKNCNFNQFIDEVSSVSGYDSLEAVNFAITKELPKVIPTDTLLCVNMKSKKSELNPGAEKKSSFSNFQYIGPKPSTIMDEDDKDLHTRFANALKSSNDIFIDSKIRPIELVSRRKSELNANKTTNYQTKLPNFDQKESLSQIEGDHEKSTENNWARRKIFLTMYVFGGKEVGQITVFKRPLSVWKLDLLTI